MVILVLAVPASPTLAWFDEIFCAMLGGTALRIASTSTA